jgi:pimeloyl-ACP methyl ester carboxylesterase
MPILKIKASLTLGLIFCLYLCLYLYLYVYKALPVIAAPANEIIKCDGAHGNGSTWPVVKLKERCTLVCIHDLACCSQSYKHLGTALSQGGSAVKVMALDLRELGIHQSIYGMREWLILPSSAGHIVDVLGEVGQGEPVYLLGEGIGASLAVDVARRKPELVKGLILSNLPPVFYKQRRTILQSGLGWIFRPTHRVIWTASDKASGIMQRHEFMPAEALGAVHYVDRIAQQACRDKKLAMPVLYIEGEDPFSSLPFALKAFKQLSADGEFVLASGGHLLLEQKQVDHRLLAAIASWLDGKRQPFLLIDDKAKLHGQVEKALSPK